MIGTATAALASAAIGAGASIYSANKAGKAANKAAARQEAAINQGLSDSGKLYDTAQGFLTPYTKMGTDQASLLQDITGVNGPEAQQRALGMYQSSPSASLLNNARDEAVRASVGAHAARGLSRSGALTQDLAERTSAMDLANYGNWENLSKGLLNTGANAAGQASTLASGRGSDILNARTAQGTARASGTVGGANAQLAGFNGMQNYAQNFLGRMSQNDWGGSGGGGDVGMNSWLPTVNATSGGIPNSAFNNFSTYPGLSF